jgi:SNF2 family DNA or RNA helicase
MGTGKTYTAAGVARHFSVDHDIIVICPKAVISQWDSVFNTLNVKPTLITNYESIRSGKHNLFYTKEYGWNRESRKLIIFDEAHKLRARKSLQTDVLRAAKEAGHKTLLLSATLVASPLDVSVIGYALGLFHSPASWWAYVRRFGGFLNHWGGYDCHCNSDNLVKLNAQLDNKGVRTTIESLGMELPCITSPELVDLGPPAKRISTLYIHLAEDLKSVMAEDDDPNRFNLAVRIGARRQIEFVKVPYLISEAEELLANGYSVIIYLNFDDTLNAVHDGLNRHYPSLIYGGQSQIAREGHINNFQTNVTKVMVANIKAGGIGLSLHDTQGNHPRVSLISPPESAIDLIQALGRIRRVGMQSPAVNRILFAANTVEEKVYENVKKKSEDIATLNDGDLDPLL